jgi:ECF transporter S component (folate family)
MFKASAKELKNPRCLTTTGILVAIYVILNVFVAFNTLGLKITFGYLALASIGMLYGPVVAMIAAIPCDLVTAMGAGLGLDFIFTPNKMLEGLIYGLLLYGLRFWGASRLNVMQTARIVTARVLVVALCHMTFNTLVLYFVMNISRESFNVFFMGRLTKNLIQLPIDIVLMGLLLPVIRLVYDKTKLIDSKGRNT